MAVIQKARWHHDRIIDIILSAEVPMDQNTIARKIGYSPTWVSIMVNSDAFQERLAERKAELTDPIIAASINERLDAVAKRSLDKIIERLDSPSVAAMRISDLVSIAKLGVGDKNTRPPGPAVQNSLYVVNLPPPAKDSHDWLENVTGANPRGVLPIVEKPPGG